MPTVKMLRTMRAAEAWSKNQLDPMLRELKPFWFEIEGEIVTVVLNKPRYPSFTMSKSQWKELLFCLNAEIKQ